MTGIEIRKLIRAQPFEPFRVHLADGRAFEVGHPELMAQSPNGRTAILFTNDGEFEILDVLMITSITASNGDSETSTSP